MTTQKQIMANLSKEINSVHSSLVYIANDFFYHLDNVGLDNLDAEGADYEKRMWFRNNESDKDEWDEKEALLKVLATIYGADYSLAYAYVKLLLVPEKFISDSDKQAMAKFKKICGIK